MDNFENPTNIDQIPLSSIEQNNNTETEMQMYARLIEEQRKAGEVDKKNNEEPIVRVKKENPDIQNIPLCVISLFIPIVGLIIWITNKNKKPIMSKACLKSSLIGIIISLILTISLNVIKVKYSTESSKNNNKYISSQIIETDDDNETNTTRPKKHISSQTDSYDTVRINGAEIKLPCSYKEFQEITNFNFVYNSDLEEKVEPASASWTSVNIYGQTLNLLFYNQKLSAQSKEKCIILGVSSDSTFMNVIPDISSSVCVSAGMSFDALMLTMDNPEFKSENFAVFTDKNYNELKVTVSNGIVKNVEIIVNQ